MAKRLPSSRARTVAANPYSRRIPMSGCATRTSTPAASPSSDRSLRERRSTRTASPTPTGSSAARTGRRGARSIASRARGTPSSPPRDLDHEPARLPRSTAAEVLALRPRDIHRCDRRARPRSWLRSARGGGCVMTFTLPQFGIFAQGTHAHHFLEFDLRPGVTAADAVGAFRRLRTPDVSAGGVNLVIAFGADAWREVAPQAAPADLAPFTPVAGVDGHRAPATQHDAWLWISGAEPDATWQSARAAALAVGPAAALAAEQVAITYRGGRDITGFVDGTANPPV